MPAFSPCPNCKAKFDFANELIGKRVRCQKCDHVFVAEPPLASVPEPSRTPGPTTPPRKGNPLLPWIIGATAAAFLLFLLFLGVGIGAFWYLSRKDSPGPVAEVGSPDGARPSRRGPRRPTTSEPEKPNNIEPEKPETEKPEPEQPVLEQPPVPSLPVDPVKPAPLKANREERRLTSTVGDACIGGGGRFFILSLPKERKIAIFDVNEAQVVKTLSVADEHVKIAAGMDKLFVVLPDKGVIQRFSLVTFEQEADAPLPIRGTVRAIATGSAAAGPLLVHYVQGRGGLDAAPVVFIDPISFKLLNFGAKGVVVTHDSDHTVHYRASPDGTVFGSWITSHSQWMGTMVLGGRSARVGRGEMAGSVVPGADNTLVTGGGLYTPTCRPRDGDKAQPRYRLRIPSQTGPFYLTCPGGGGAQLNTGEMETSKPVEAYLVGNPRPITFLKGVELPASNEAWTFDEFTQDKRVLFVPEGKLIAVVPNSNDRLILHRFDIEKAVDTAGMDYLYVVSRPPRWAYKGTPYAYPVQVKSKQGGLKFKLESGPEGMKVEADGNLTWDVPKDFAGAEVSIILTVGDASGKEVFHTFWIAVGRRL